MRILRIWGGLMIPIILGACQRESDPYAGRSVSSKQDAIALICHRNKNTPRVGGKAPDVKVIQSQNGEKVRLAQFWREKPAVLIFGSLSCDQTHQNIQSLLELYQKHRETHQFVFIYLREAHAVDGWADPASVNTGSLSLVVEPKTDQLRMNVSQRFCQKFVLPFPVVVDRVNDTAAVAYAAWPSRLFVVEKNGRVSFSGGVGPWEYRPLDATPPFFVIIPSPESMNLQGLRLAPSWDAVPSLESFLREFSTSK